MNTATHHRHETASITPPHTALWSTKSTDRQSVEADPLQTADSGRDDSNDNNDHNNNNNDNNADPLGKTEDNSTHARDNTSTGTTINGYHRNKSTGGDKSGSSSDPGIKLHSSSTNSDSSSSSDVADPLSQKVKKLKLQQQQQQQQQHRHHLQDMDHPLNLGQNTAADRHAGHAHNHASETSDKDKAKEEHMEKEKDPIHAGESTDGPGNNERMRVQQWSNTSDINAASSERIRHPTANRTTGHEHAIDTSAGPQPSVASRHHSHYQDKDQNSDSKTHGSVEDATDSNSSRSELDPPVTHASTSSSSATTASIPSTQGMSSTIATAVSTPRNSNGKKTLETPTMGAETETERHDYPVTSTERAVRDPLAFAEAGGGSSLSRVGAEGLPQPAQRLHSRARTLSSPAPPPTQSRMQSHQPSEHLTDMGPLEMGQEIDSGLRARREKSTATAVASSAPSSARLAIINSDSLGDSLVDISVQQPLHRLAHRPSSSTLVSESSHSSHSTVESSRRVDQEAEVDGQGWSGGHPLLMNYSAEPDLLDDFDETYKDRDTAPSFPQDRAATGLRNKGHSMSVDVRQQQNNGTDMFQSGLSARRRRNLSKANEGDKSWATDEYKDDTGHSRNMTETVGKQVIIHQITVSDTLAGIALYYGIQVSVLKKSNKLWTNDSIHTRKYLYIPFEECTVARQAGVLVDENNHTVILPQRIQQQASPHHSRAGSAMLPAGQVSSSMTSSRVSTFDSASGYPSNSSLPNSQHASGSLQTIKETGRATGKPSLSIGLVPPPISAVAAGMLPHSSSTMGGNISDSISVSNSSPRVGGTWIDAKCLAAPPVPSPTMTSATLKSDNSLKAAPLSPPPRSRRSATESSSRAYPPYSIAMGGSSLAGISENLPNTVMVPPSMTHEALAARFKEMDLVSTEQQNLHHKFSNQEQELRTNPVHQRHRTMDLRQYAAAAASAAAAVTASGSRRTSVDNDTSGEPSRANGAPGPLGRSGSALDGLGAARAVIEEEKHDEERDRNQNDFVAYGHQQFIYDTDDLQRGNNGTAAGSDSNDPTTSDPTGAATTTLRRQELVTIPAGMLSFFPSPEHSKKLETPQSISRLQSRMDSYQGSSLSGSSTSSGSFRDTLASKDGSGRKGGAGAAQGGSRSKGRAALGDQTFQAPSSSSSSSAASTPSSRRPAPLSTSDSTRASAARQGRRTASSSHAAHSPTSPLTPSTPSRAAAHSKTVRVNQQYYTPQTWSIMGESLVDDLLGAVRGPLQIARRVYNFTTLGFSAAMGGSGKDAHVETPNIRRRTSTRGSSGRSRGQRNKEFRNSAIELDQAGANGLSAYGNALSSSGAASSRSNVTKSPSISRRVPSSSTSPKVDEIGSEIANTDSGTINTRVTRRTPSNGSGHLSSTRKRSLRSSNPINHAALMALVTELDKDKREKDEQEKKGGGAGLSTSGSDGSSLRNRNPSSSNPLSMSPAVSVLTTSL